MAAAEPMSKVIFGDREPVTVIVTRRVRAGNESAYEAWIHGVSEVAHTFTGHMGINVIRPVDGGREYVLIFRFDSHANLKVWVESAVRAKWVKQADELCEGPAKVQQLTGMEAWFTLPDKPLRPPPPRYKMASLSFLAVFPLINLMNAVVAPALASLPVPGPIRMLPMIALMITLMTYVIMPFLTRLFYRWLYPAG